MSQEHIDQAIERDYAAGFISAIESDTLPPGLDEDVIRFISGKKDEPQWLLEWRLEAYRGWQQMAEPDLGPCALPDDRSSRRFPIFPRPRAWKTGPRAWTRSTRTCWRPMKSWDPPA